MEGSAVVGKHCVGDKVKQAGAVLVCLVEGQSLVW